MLFRSVVSNGTFNFVPIREDLQKNDYVLENLNILEDGEVQYMQDGQVVSHKGIDVSKHQGNIDWTKVAADGVEFAFIRVGLRGYGTEGKLVEDEYFEQNINGFHQTDDTDLEQILRVITSPQESFHDMVYQSEIFFDQYFSCFFISTL